MDAYYSLSFSERLVLLRNSAGLSKTELAKNAGIALSTLSKYEKGLSTPNYNIAKNLAQALGVSLNQLILGFNDAKSDIPVKPLIED